MRKSLRKVVQRIDIQGLILRSRRQYRLIQAMAGTTGGGYKRDVDVFIGDS